MKTLEYVTRVRDIAQNIGVPFDGILDLAIENIGIDNDEREIKREYERLSLTFNEIYEEIFERAIGDGVIKGDMRRELSSVHDRVRVLIHLKDTIHHLYIRCEGMREPVALMMFSEAINFDGRSLYDIVDKVYRDLYD